MRTSQALTPPAILACRVAWPEYSPLVRTPNSCARTYRFTTRSLRASSRVCAATVARFLARSLGQPRFGLLWWTGWFNIFMPVLVRARLG